MPVYVPISMWITESKVWQYLKANILAKQRIFQGGSLVPDYSYRLRILRKSIEWAYGQNANDPTLNVTGTYMISLVDRTKADIIINGGSCIPPTITQNPNSQTIASGGTATFSVLATGTGTLSYQWQLNLTNINGATSSSYTTPSVTTGGNYRCIVSNACGSVVSGTAVLTVNAPQIQFTIGWSASDPFVNNTTPLTITNSTTVNYTPGSQIVYTGSLASFANTYIMLSFPATETTPTNWFNTMLNSGPIPDFSFRDVYTVGLTKYICARNPVVLDTTANISFNH